MKIAFVSYEFLPDTPFGGIATYVWHASRMLARAGHYVEVVCGTSGQSRIENADRVIVNKIHIPEDFDSRNFGILASEVLASRHRTVSSFDVVESTDINAEAAEFLVSHPEVPMVTKLHTPYYLVLKFSTSHFGWRQKLRFALGAIRRGDLPKWPKILVVNPDYLDFERKFALQSDVIAAPCKDIARIVGEDWNIPDNFLQIFNLPFESADDLFEIPIINNTISQNILFVGRLEPRKGVHFLAEALRILRREFPDVKLRCVGRDSHSPVIGRKMEEHMRRLAGSDACAMEFPGAKSRDLLAEEFSKADVCVFPSLWENFPYVCQEAMTAGRAIVGSSAGGMVEMLSNGAGILVEPRSAQRLAEAIATFLRDRSLRQNFGQEARSKVTRDFSYKSILPLQIDCYERAIRHRREKGSRGPNCLPIRPKVLI